MPLLKQDRLGPRTRNAASSAAPLAAQAQTWPDKPIKFVMSAPAGSSIDVLGRTIADKLKDRLGQPVIVENKPAAGGTVAVEETAKAAPDGYTMVLALQRPAGDHAAAAQGPVRRAEGPRAGDHDHEPAERAGRQRRRCRRRT